MVILKLASAQLRVIGISKDPDNNDAGSANVNFVVTIINEHFLKGTAGSIRRINYGNK